MQISPQTIAIAMRNASLMQCMVIIYQYRGSIILMPVGYKVPEGTKILGYVTRELEFIEKDGNGHETTENNGVNSNT